jgi:ribonuclease Z
MAHIGGIFYTHFHSDHIADLGEFNMNSWVLGRTAPLDVYGPPGVEGLVAGFSQAYALDQTYRTAHHGADIANPELWKMVPHTVAMPGDATAAKSRSAVVLEADGLKITAFEVNHAPIEPDYGYRFDYKGRSIVITGDTAKHEAIVAAAKGADVLFHEAQNQEMVKTIQSKMLESGNARFAKILGDIQNYHSSPVDAADIANRAGVKLLVLYHFTPSVLNALVERMFVRGLAEARDGEWLMSKDGTLVELPLDKPETVTTSLLQ